MSPGPSQLLPQKPSIVGRFFSLTPRSLTNNSLSLFLTNRGVFGEVSCCKRHLKSQHSRECRQDVFSTTLSLIICGIRRAMQLATCFRPGPTCNDGKAQNGYSVRATPSFVLVVIIAAFMSFNEHRTVNSLCANYS